MATYQPVQENDDVKSNLYPNQPQQPMQQQPQQPVPIGYQPAQQTTQYVPPVQQVVHVQRVATDLFNRTPMILLIIGGIFAIVGMVMNPKLLFTIIAYVCLLTGWLGYKGHSNEQTKTYANFCKWVFIIHFTINVVLILFITIPILVIFPSIVIIAVIIVVCASICAANHSDDQDHTYGV